MLKTWTGLTYTKLFTQNVNTTHTLPQWDKTTDWMVYTPQWEKAAELTGSQPAFGQQLG